jgi:isopentenyldiphosphate isomerase
MEILDIVDENGKPKGKTVEREKAHAEGIMHRTSHVWLLRKRSGKVQVLLQKRCETKETFPGCYDISSAGHIPAGMDFAESAIRELKEELGITASADELILCGDRIAIWDDNFHGKPFHDRQYARVFALWRDLDECMASVEKNLIKHCIYFKELEMVKENTSWFL